MKPYTILVVEDNAIASTLVRITLEKEGYQVIEVRDGQTALELMARRPDLVLQDLVLPDLDGFELVRRLHELPGCAEIPVIAFSGFLSKKEQARTQQVGFTDYLSKPVEPSRIVDTVATYLPAAKAYGTTGTGQQLLVVDDDPVQLRLTKLRLTLLGFRVATAASGAEAVKRARRWIPAAIVSDVVMPEMDGFRLCLAIRQDPKLAEIPVVLYSSAYTEDEDRRLARSVGAHTLVTRTPDLAELAAAIVSALETPPPAVAMPAVIETREYQRRLLRQLDRQMLANATLARRLSTRETELAILSGLCDGLNGGATAAETANELLGRVLSAAGVSQGAIYTVKADGTLTLAADLGFPAADRAALADLFGHAHLLDRARERREPIVAPSLIPTANAPALAGEQAVSGLVIPLLAAGDCLGVLALVSWNRDLTDDWDPFARAVGARIGRALELYRVLARVRESEQRYRDLVTDVPVGLCRTAPAGEFLDANPAMVQMLGFPDRETLLTTNITALYLNPAARGQRIALLQDSYGPQVFEQQLRRRDGTPIWIRTRAQAVRDGSGSVVYFEGAMIDVTDEKQAADRLRASEERFRELFEHLPIGLCRTAPDGRIIDANAALMEMLGYADRESLLAGNARDWYVDPGDRAQWLEHMDRSGAGRGHETRMVRRDGTVIWARDTARAVQGADGTTLYYDGAIEDITARREAEEGAKRQLNRLASLRTIDLAITASLDLRVTLSVLLDQVTAQLGADAADVLLYDPQTYKLQRSAARGLRPNARGDASVAEYLAERAALETRIIAVANVAGDPAARRSAAALRKAGFGAYFAAPLVAKAQVNGVLEVFYRRPLSPDDDWLEFLEALAGQAAIAVDNAALFGDLQRSNMGLLRAYDTTLEGWVRALDLRDKETEGHTRRVTELTVQLARTMGLADAELTHVRRGALLHDIGKIGIPDSILLKPGPLTDEEWTVMRRHPEYANDLLTPIEYLRPATAIPYCHHEQWDGTGYPRRLRGEQIPLAARIFAVIDVWDALRSDRPYRRAWPEERVLQYIRAQRGGHFDPAVVDAALGLLTTGL